MAAYHAAVARGAAHDQEYRMVAADGHAVHVHDVTMIELDSAGRPALERGVIVDVSARLRAEERVHHYADIVERIQVALFIVRPDDLADPASMRIVAANPQTEVLTHRVPDELVGRRIHDAFPPLARTQLTQRLAHVIQSGEAFDVETMVVDQRGMERIYSLHAFPLPGGAAGLSLDDVTGPRMAAEALRRQALHDSLTGLPNRSLLNDRLQQALRAAQRTGSSVALLVMDLDQFKEINDALGHHHGDRLLVELGRRLEHLVRDSDTIARLGGDEFAILLTVDADRDGAVTVAEKVARSLEQPVELDGISIQTNASIGIALFPEHASDAEALARRADVAMYMAKRSGASWALYAAEQDRSSIQRLTLLGELRRALTLDELVLHYQPSVDLQTGAVVQAEALVRWEHPLNGLMAPLEFIPLAEVSGLINPLTRWVIERAIRQGREWRDGGWPIGVAVNLSVRNLYDRGLGPWLSELLASSGLPPESLTLEITENEFMDDPRLAIEVLGEAKAMGASTSIDDFGTGYSSLAYLKHLPLDEIKIDCAFVRGMRSETSDAVIVRSIIDLGHDLGLSVVAEGVEDAETAQLLTSLGCDRAQGFHLGRPVLPTELARWRVDWPAVGAAPGPL
jgi:diguanylate cyclase (GGDEF)-like protein